MPTAPRIARRASTCIRRSVPAAHASAPMAIRPTARRSARPRPSSMRTGGRTCPTTSSSSRRRSQHRQRLRCQQHLPAGDRRRQPCQSAETVADGIKSAGVTIYSIGYALGSATKCTAGKWPTVVTTPGDPGSPAVYKPNGTLKTPAVPPTPEISRWCDPALDGTCAHTADDRNESPAITSVEALTDIASPGTSTTSQPRVS